jgi:hypothetical protein
MPRLATIEEVAFLASELPEVSEGDRVADLPYQEVVLAYRTMPMAGYGDEACES